LLAAGRAGAAGFGDAGGVCASAEETIKAATDVVASAATARAGVK
jgi:hypothetical protein